MFFSLKLLCKKDTYNIMGIIKKNLNIFFPIEHCIVDALNLVPHLIHCVCLVLVTLCEVDNKCMFKHLVGPFLYVI
jgi:hypothetical protein